MIVNAALDERIYKMLHASNCHYCCLFDKNKNIESQNEVAPYLLKVTPNDSFFLWCCNEGITENWIFFLYPKNKA